MRIRGIISSGLLLVAVLLSLSGCYWWFASLDAQILFSAMPGSTLTFVFDASTSTASWTEIRGYQWDFGDGTESTQDALFHKYKAEGTYTGSLTIDNGLGLSSTASVIISAYIVAENVDPNAS